MGNCLKKIPMNSITNKQSYRKFFENGFKLAKKYLGKDHYFSKKFEFHILDRVHEFIEHESSLDEIEELSQVNYNFRK